MFILTGANVLLTNTFTQRAGAMRDCDHLPSTKLGARVLNITMDALPSWIIEETCAFSSKKKALLALSGNVIDCLLAEF